ncbi:MAG: chaperonin GroEL [Chlamydiia bacterium]|nr:chaperonin GroEL [Chlamydiia bacterium]
MPKLIQYTGSALKSILKGVQTLAKAVKVTLGPRGRNVVINKSYGTPLSTKDGVTVADEIALKDPFELMGAQVAKQVASKTSDVAGDGTTTAIVLIEALYTAGIKNVTAGANPTEVKRGIDIAVEWILEALDKLATPVESREEIEQIATISANNDPEIGKIIADAMDKVGKDGIISVGEAKSIETTLDVVEGMEFKNGFLSPYFITNPEQMRVEYANPLFLISDKKISSAREIVPILEKLNQHAKGRPLVIIAEDVDSEALATLVVNKLQGGFPLCAVKAPGFGDRRKEMLQDMATLTGATVICEELGMKLEDVKLEDLGSAKSVKVDKETTTIVDGAGQPEEIKSRVAEIKSAIERTESSYDREKLEERLAKMVGGVAVVNTGAATQAEMKEKKARVEDALHATRAAVKEGIVPGGGVALLRALKAIKGKIQLEGDQAVGVSIVEAALYAPATAIANNCGEQGGIVAETVYRGEGGYGYNGLTGKYGDLIAEGVIDPVMVTKTALVNAASAAALLLSVDCMIANKPEPKKAHAPDMGGMGMGGMGGMGMGGMGGMGMM